MRIAVHKMLPIVVNGCLVHVSNGDMWTWCAVWSGDAVICVCSQVYGQGTRPLDFLNANMKAHVDSDGGHVPVLWGGSDGGHVPVLWGGSDGGHSCAVGR